MMHFKVYPIFIIWWIAIHSYYCDVRVGPDPWDYVVDRESVETDRNSNTPPDLKIPVKKRIPTNNNLGTGEWFFKRTLAIVLNGGQTQINEDGSVEISIQMKFDQNRWETLNQYVKSNIALTEDMFRRSIGYVEEAIYKPTVTEKIVLAWNEYIQFYLMEYKTQLTLFFGVGAVVGLLFWLWRHVSNKHILIIIFIGLYIYEVIISYKEAEQKELERFMSAVNKCSWFFWKSSCEVPPPDPLIFMKYMNPLKISIRMFTSLISEPMLALSVTVNAMVHSMTDGLWFPFDKIFHGLLILCINVLMIFLLIMIIFNFLLNIPFHLSFLGLVNIGIKQRKRNLNENDNCNNTPKSGDNTDRISGATLNRLLDVCSRALDNSQNRLVSNSNTNITNNTPKIKRSASTGRLPTSSESLQLHHCDNNIRRRNNAMFMIGAGDGKMSLKNKS